MDSVQVEIDEQLIYEEAKAKKIKNFINMEADSEGDEEDDFDMSDLEDSEPN